jgi:hypothetical protein
MPDSRIDGHLYAVDYVSLIKLPVRLLRRCSPAREVLGIKKGSSMQSNKMVVLTLWSMFMTMSFGYQVSAPFVGPDWAPLFGMVAGAIYYSFAYNTPGTAARASFLLLVFMAVAYAFHNVIPEGRASITVLVLILGLLMGGLRRRFLGDKWAAGGGFDPGAQV